MVPSQGVFSDVNQNHPSSSSNNLVYFTSFCTLTFNTITFLGPKAAVVSLLSNPWGIFNRWGVLEEEQTILLPSGVCLIWKTFEFQFGNSSGRLALEMLKPSHRFLNYCYKYSWKLWLIFSVLGKKVIFIQENTKEIHKTDLSNWDKNSIETTNLMKFPLCFQVQYKKCNSRNVLKTLWLNLKL